MRATLVNIFVFITLWVDGALLDEHSGSNNNNGQYSFHNQYQEFNRKEGRPYSRDSVYQARTYQGGEYPDSIDMIRPMENVQYIESDDGRVKIINRVGGGRMLNPSPIYLDKSRKLIDPNNPTKYRSHRQNIPANYYVPISNRPRVIPVQENYTRKKNTIRFPSKNEKLVSQSIMSLNNERIVPIPPHHGHSDNTKKKIDETLGQDSSAAIYVSRVEDPNDEVEDFSGLNNYDNKRYPYRPPIVVFPPNRGGGFEKEGGTSYNYGNQVKEGENTDKGHKSHESYHKGHAEQHGHAENKEKYADDSGKKIGHHHEKNHYSKGHHASSGQKESGKELNKGHKKGHKTKGFHTVHHKDEYKKDEVFYDEEHDVTNQSHSGHDNIVHEHAEGGKEQKGQLNSGYRDHGKENHGVKEEGHSYENNEGAEGQEGGSSHHSHLSHYKAGEGNSQGEVHRQGKLGHF